MTFTLALDILVAGLLVVTIAYAVVLNRRLGMLRRDKTELEGLAANFGEATMRAGDSIVKLKTTAEELQNRIEKAEALRDDLVFLIDRGDASADRLEEAVRAGRKEGNLVPEPLAKTAAEKPASKGGRKEVAMATSQAERELLKALHSTR